MRLIVKTGPNSILKKALRNYYINASNHQIDLDLFIIDSSYSPVDRNKNKEEAREICREFRTKIKYSSIRERQDFIKSLDKEGISSASYALSDSNNVALLGLDEGIAIFINDSIYLKAIKNPISNIISFRKCNSYLDPYNFESEVSLSEATRDNLDWADINLTVLEEDLNSSYANLRPKYANSGYLVKGEPFGVVFIISPGIVGYLNTYTEHYSYMRGDFYSSVNPSIFGSRIPKHIRFQSSSLFLDTIFGFNIAKNLPPFIPSGPLGRGGDNLYGKILGIFFPHALTKFVPIGFKNSPNNLVTIENFDNYDCFYYALNDFKGKSFELADHLLNITSKNFYDIAVEACSRQYKWMSDRSSKMQKSLSVPNSVNIDPTILMNYGNLLKDWGNIVEITQALRDKGKSLFMEL